MFLFSPFLTKREETLGSRVLAGSGIQLEWNFIGFFILLFYNDFLFLATDGWFSSYCSAVGFVLF